MKSIWKMTGVYSIRHIASGKRYVGSASRGIGYRWWEHKHHLSKGQHHSKHLQSAWNKYGPDAFVFEILERCLPEHAIAVEQVMMDYYRAADQRYGYNIAATAGSRRGIPHDAESRKKIGDGNRGKIVSDATARRLSESLIGRVVTEETRLKLSIAMTGKTHTLETRAKISRLCKGYVRTAEHNQKLSQVRRGKVRTEEQRENMRRGIACAKLRRASLLLSILPPFNL
jgi:group I intron endonuclease